MARNFDWRIAGAPDSPLFERCTRRYEDTQCVGGAVWTELTHALAPLFPDANADWHIRSHPAEALFWQEQRLIEFLDALRNMRKRRRPRRVYIGYHQSDVVEAKRLAHLANTAGMAYWLDAYDCHRHEPGMQQNPLASTLTAASIEMGLLNCSHAISVGVDGFRDVDWGAYLIARGREHLRLAGRCGIWREPTQYAVERSGLGISLSSDRAVWQWFRTPDGSTPAVAGNPGPSLSMIPPPERRQAEHRRAAKPRTSLPPNGSERPRVVANLIGRTVNGGAQR